ncbi:hypothetical protein [Candidatus Mesenet endosymbiont of Phosphuga atrata]|uniref:hypothetical protein n=1 Tax=Candidatus Mesenet endosymbiont of Phosphuga atrata TaxID=3066221 RepID=UPI0030D27453
MKQLLTLVWKACNDENKESADPGTDINERILQRKFQLVKQLIESQTEYGVYNGRGANACFTGAFNSITSSLYGFEEFSFLQKLDKDTARIIFSGELQNRGENLFNQLSNDDDKKAVATALSNVSVTNFVLEYIESFKAHSARAVLGDKECNKLVKDHLENLQHSEVVSPFVS